MARIMVQQKRAPGASSSGNRGRSPWRAQWARRVTDGKAFGKGSGVTRSLSVAAWWHWLGVGGAALVMRPSCRVAHLGVEQKAKEGEDGKAAAGKKTMAVQRVKESSATLWLL